jgi:hypothetical protein
MIHGELGRRKGSMAVVTGSFGTLPLPPLGVSEVPGFAPLAFDVCFGQIVCKRFHIMFRRITQLSISSFSIL